MPEHLSEDEYDRLPDDFAGVDWSALAGLESPGASTSRPAPPRRTDRAPVLSDYGFDEIDGAALAAVDAVERRLSQASRDSGSATGGTQRAGASAPSMRGEARRRADGTQLLGLPLDRINGVVLRSDAPSATAKRRLEDDGADEGPAVRKEPRTHAGPPGQRVTAEGGEEMGRVKAAIGLFEDEVTCSMYVSRSHRLGIERAGSEPSVLADAVIYCTIPAVDERPES
jgi:hypothetical protein